LVAKEETSLYEAGPTRRWLKGKQKGWTVDEDRWQRRIRTVSLRCNLVEKSRTAPKPDYPPFPLP